LVFLGLEYGDTFALDENGQEDEFVHAVLEELLTHHVLVHVQSVAVYVQQDFYHSHHLRQPLPVLLVPLLPLPLELQQQHAHNVAVFSERSSHPWQQIFVIPKGRHQSLFRSQIAAHVHQILGDAAVADDLVSGVSFAQDAQNLVA
jgi:hypothetical protein